MCEEASLYPNDERPSYILSTRKMEKAREILLEEMMSSEEEDINDPTVRGRQGRVVKSLIWESNKSKKIKKRIDQYFLDHVATRAQLNSMAPVHYDSDILSSRLIPEGVAPAWAIKEGDITIF